MNATDNFLRFRRMFYLVAPQECMYDSLTLVPNYVTEAIPYFLLMVIVETIIVMRKKSKFTGNDISDSIGSLSAGILSQLPLIFMRSTELVSYVWVYDNYRLFDLPSKSVLVWLLGMLGVDFGYYWVHRASHEISLFWSGHQAHHSSQRYNLTTALRQGVFQRYFSWIFYLPLAIALPPTVFLVHIQFNLLYQFWIHTEVVGKLGFLEYFLNTPSHHRVHHGRNRYCIDKNYGGTLIVFDRMFGTFEEENENVVYGVVHTIQTWNPIEIQVCHFRYVIQQCWNTIGVSNKLRVLFYGPGWEPGTQRLGDISKIPHPEQPIKFYGKNINNGVIVYCLVNFLFTNVAYWLLAAFVTELAFEIRFIVTAVIVASLIQIGRILDGKNVFWSECVRIISIVAILSSLLTY